MMPGKRLSLLLVLCFAFSLAIAQKSPASEADLKKQAEKLFEKQNYEEATPMYSQLLSLYPREPIYNYRYGVCLLLSGRDKTGAATYLEVAAKAKETDPDVYFYLGRSYMFMEHYNEAISAFTLFKKNSLPSKQIVLQPDVFIRNCENADQLRKDRKNVVVLNKRKVNRTAFFASYDFSEAAGKLLTTPDRFLTPLDKEKMPNPVMFMAKDGETIYYASYGKKGENGKDIYRIIKLPDGSWSIPVNLGPVINTAANEDFPYLDKDGRTLYFCSNGTNSIGGYDIFKTQYDFNTGKWSEPVNVGVPVNTVDDDIFYLPSTKGLTATYATAVDCESGKIEIRNVKLGDVVSNIAVISGKYFSQDQVTRRDARISVIRTKDNGIVTSVKTDRTGDYELILPAGDEYMLLVEGGSYLPHAELFSVPAGSSASGLKQRISMNKTRDTEEMTMTNFFSPSQADPFLVTMEKPTQVVKSAFDVKDTANSKMQPITFEGKTLFVAPPSLQRMETRAGEPLAAGPEPGQPVNENAEPVNKEVNEKPQGEQEQAQLNDTEKNTEVQEEKAAEKETPIVNEENVVTDKTSNTSLVKMAFEDAAAIREESEVLHESALEKTADARALDSLANVQLKQANELLKAGNTEAAEETIKESKENAIAARQLEKEADSIQSASNERKTEAEIAYREASQLMKDFRVDTTAIAYQSEAGGETGKRKALPGNSKKADTAPSSPPAPGTTATSSESVHYEKAKVLSDEAARLLLAADEMSEKANGAKDKSRKTYYQKKAADFKKQSEIRKTEAQKETAMAVNANEKPLEAAVPDGVASAQAEQLPVTGNDNSKALAENSGADRPVKSKNEEKGNTSADAGGKDETLLNNVAQKSSDPNKLPAETGKEKPAENQPVKNANEKSETQPAGAEISKSVNDPGKNVPAEKETADAVKEVIPQQPASAKNDTVTGKQKEIVEETVAHNANTKVQHEPVSEKTIPSPVADEPTGAVLTTPENKVERTPATLQPESGKEPVNGPVAAENKSKPAETIAADPVAVVHFQNYRQQLAESKRIENLSKETEARLFAPESKQKRDSLEAKTAELNRKSISVWQSAQKELALARQIDPEIESKAATTEIENPVATGDQTQEGKPAANAGETKPLAMITPEERRQDDAKGQGEETETEAPVAVALDTTKPEYPKYVETQKAILEKQTETVNLFVEGMQLNRKVVAIKADEMKLRDQAEVSTDKKQRNKLVEKADSLAMEAEIISNHSKEMLSRAQQNTGKVKELTAKSEQLKSQLVIKPVGQEVAINKEVQKPEAVQEKEINEAPVSLQGRSEQKESPLQPGARGNAAPDAIGAEKQETPGAEVSVNETGREQLAGAEQESKAKAPGKPAQPPIYPVSKEMNAPQPVTPAAVSAIVSESTEPQQEPVVVLPEIEISDAATFSFGKGDAYSAEHPIPIDPVLPEGLVFKVQIGAFRKKLPDNTFKNLQPLSGETTRPGWIRYCLGLFRTFEPANLLKKEVRGMGYKDAFVVAYFNGKRIPLYDAYALISKANAEVKQTYAAVADKEFNQLAKFEIRKSNATIQSDDDSRAFYGTTENVSPDKVEYAVQIGVYRSAKIPAVLNALLPVNTEQMRSGLYRFTTGRFDNRASADSMKRIAVANGVKDAFVVIYKGGTKANAADIAALNAASAGSAGKTTPVVAMAKQDATQPVVNPGEVIFKVQIGAFKENVPMNTVTTFLAIADKGISRETDDRGLNIFYAGSYKSYAEVVAARSEIVSKGIKDAFIVAFKGGKRTTLSDVLKDLNSK